MNKNQQATLNGMQVSLTIVWTVSTVDVSTTTTVLISGFSAITHSKATTTPIYQVFIYQAHVTAELIK